jgi:large conductance mechanosensitive channel
MGLAKEFRSFAMRGNVVDMAVGIIIGGAFGKIVSSIVNDVIMPPIGLVIGGVDFTDLKITMKDQVLDGAGKVVSDAVYLRYGNFLQTTVDFLIIAFAVFLIIKLMNRMQRKEEPIPAPPPPPVLTNEEKLLGEIRDLLKNK